MKYCSLTNPFFFKSYHQKLLYQLIMITLYLNPITPGVSDQRLLPGGVFRTRSYFQLIWTSFWTHGTIIDQFIVKGVHQ